MKKLIFTILFCLICSSARAETFASYPTTNNDYAFSLQVQHPAPNQFYNSAGGQAFTASGTHELGSCQFYLKMSTTYTGTVIARLYNATGTVGTDAVPTGNAVASSDSLDISTVTTSYDLYTFTFSSPPTLTDGEDYVIVLELSSWVFGSFYTLFMGSDVTTPSDGGNAVYYAGGWAGTNMADFIYYLNGASSEPPSGEEVYMSDRGIGRGIMRGVR